MKHKFVLENAHKFGWEGLEGYVYNSKEDFERASIAVIEITKQHGPTKNLINDRIYYVIEGEGHFIIENEKFVVKKN